MSLAENLYIDKRWGKDLHSSGRTEQFQGMGWGEKIPSSLEKGSIVCFYWLNDLKLW